MAEYWKEIILCFSSIYFIIFSFMTQTENGLSALIFKIVPFFCGFGCGLVALKMLGVI
jgi:hypothetical protein